MTGQPATSSSNVLRMRSSAAILLLTFLGACGAPPDRPPVDDSRTVAHSDDAPAVAARFILRQGDRFAVTARVEYRSESALLKFNADVEITVAYVVTSGSEDTTSTTKTDAGETWVDISAPATVQGVIKKLRATTSRGFGSDVVPDMDWDDTKPLDGIRGELADRIRSSIEDGIKADVGTDGSVWSRSKAFDLNGLAILVPGALLGVLSNLPTARVKIGEPWGRGESGVFSNPDQSSLGKYESVVERVDGDVAVVRTHRTHSFESRKDDFSQATEGEGRTWFDLKRHLPAKAAGRYTTTVRLGGNEFRFHQAVEATLRKD